MITTVGHVQLFIRLNPSETLWSNGIEFHGRGFRH